MKRIVLYTVLWLALMAGPASAGIPTIDGANLVQSIMGVLETINQTQQMIQQYSTQLRQYENQLQNTMGPSTYIWSNAQGSINGLLGAINTIEYYRGQLGTLDRYLNNFQDVGHYQSLSSLTSRNCTPAQTAQLTDSERFTSEAQKRSNDASMQGINQQQESLRQDAQTLSQLQANAQTATGQMQAIQYGNQFAGNQASQLMQIRGLLIAEQNAMVTRQQALADQEAKEEASAEQLRKGDFVSSPRQGW